MEKERGEERRGEERRGRCWEKVETERREDGEERKHLSRITFTFLSIELLNHSADTQTSLCFPGNFWEKLVCFF